MPKRLPTNRIVSPLLEQPSWEHAQAKADQLMNLSLTEPSFRKIRRFASIAFELSYCVLDLDGELQSECRSSGLASPISFFLKA